MHDLQKEAQAKFSEYHEAQGSHASIWYDVIF